MCYAAAEIGVQISRRPPRTSTHSQPFDANSARCGRAYRRRVFWVIMFYTRSTLRSATSTTHRRQPIISSNFIFSLRRICGRKPVSRTPSSLTLPVSRRRRRARRHVGLPAYAVLGAQLLQSVAQEQSPARAGRFEIVGQGLRVCAFPSTGADARMGLAGNGQKP